MGLDNLIDGFTKLSTKIKGILTTPLGAAAGGVVTGAIVGGTVVKVASAIKKRRKKARRKRARSRRGRRRKLKFGSKAYRKKYLGRHKHRRSSGGKLSHHKHRRRPSGKGIHFTKHGQPYIILSSGKARFVSKRGARASKKRKGGRY